ncbi:MAG TPA: glycosyltransferase family 2 protein, partial [Candidatus Binataceae bacterium]|nr:glycosyltransferase family 2 protein [Candidatus Binataceae bacterium]
MADSSSREVVGQQVRRAPGKSADTRPTLVERLSGISVFLLAHNEEGNIQRVIEGFRAELPKLTNDYEIIVVDDGSRDQTGQIAERMAISDRHISVVHHRSNRGYGGAVISGINAASKPYVLLCDGDGQFDP